MKTKVAVAMEVGKPFEIVEAELDGPKAGEVLVKWKVAGLCHSDLHISSGDMPSTLPLVVGHEGSGIVEEVGPGVTRVKPGDHVVGSFIPGCGTCAACSRGMSNLCNEGWNGTTGLMADGRFPFVLDGGQGAGGMCNLGTFADRAICKEQSVVPVQEWIPFETAALVGCGVTTGYSSTVKTAGVTAGDIVVVFGIGGLGANALQAARLAGARYIIAIDSDAAKKDVAMTFGATHFFSDPTDAAPVVNELSWGEQADKAIITIGVADAAVTEAAFNMLGKRGVLVLVSMGAMDNYSVSIPGLFLCQFEKSIKGSLFGSANANYDIPNLLKLWDQKHIMLDELITHRFTLDEVNKGYEMMETPGSGLLRGLIIHEDD